MTEPLRGAYIARLDLTQPHLAGVATKIRGQIAALEALPARIELVHPAGATIQVDGQVWKQFGTGRFATRLTYYFHYYRMLARRWQRLDFVYIRCQGCSPLFLWMLRQLRRRHREMIILIELPSYPFHTEAKSLRERVFLLVDRSTRGLLRRYVDRIVTFSRAEQIFGIETIRTDNGVDLNGIKVSAGSDAADRMHLLGLANLSFWHGYDRIIAGLANYRALGGQRTIHFDVVGAGAELERLKSMANELDVTDSVTFWGPRKGDELEEIVSRAHVAISSIGMHRLHVDTSNIKSREFCARGLPFVIGYPDPDFDAEFPFALQVPPDDSAIDIAKLVEFYEQLLSEGSDYKNLMREYAQRCLTWGAKMAPVTAVLRALIPLKS